MKKKKKHMTRYTKKQLEEMNLTQHHKLPKSRSGQTVEGNLKYITRELHNAWHYLFFNMTPQEIWVSLFREQFQFSTNTNIADRQWLAWKEIFGCTVAPKEAAQIVRDEWWPADGLPSHDGTLPTIPKKEVKND